MNKKDKKTVIINEKGYINPAMQKKYEEIMKRRKQQKGK